MIWLAGFAVGARALARDRQADRADELARAAIPTSRGPIGDAATATLSDTPEEALSAAGAGGSTPGSEIRLLDAALEPIALAGLSADAAKKRASAWSQAVARGGATPTAALNELLPSTAWFQARLIMERDEPTLEGNAEAVGPSGVAYGRILESLPVVKASAPAFEAVLKTIWDESKAAGGLARGPSAPIARSQRWMPTRGTLDAGHRYALDIFFTAVRRSGAEEIGPVIRSMTRGIVVSAAGDWRGGDTLASYASGGLSPKSGNGAIVFCPDDGRYYAYFHLRDVSVRAGQMIPAGQVLGHGGNTGANARKKGHGEHLHIEIHTGPGLALTSYEIRAFAVELK